MTMSAQREARLADLTDMAIQSGGHGTFDDGHCAMELVAWLAGEPHTDAPECTSPVLGAFVRRWNDGLADDEARALLLRPFLPRLVDTRGSHDIEEQRAWLATDWLVRVCAPAFLRLTPSLREHASALAELPPVLSCDSHADSREVIDAAGAAARAAAIAAAGAAAWAGAAARAAAGDAAGAAAGDAAGAAAGAAVGVAAGAAAGAPLVPVVAGLQASAVDLLDRMIDVKEKA